MTPRVVFSKLSDLLTAVAISTLPGHLHYTILHYTTLHYTIYYIILQDVIPDQPELIWHRALEAGSTGARCRIEEHKVRCHTGLHHLALSINWGGRPFC